MSCGIINNINIDHIMAEIEDAGGFKLPEGWFEFEIITDNIKKRDMGLPYERSSKAVIKLSEINCFFDSSDGEDEDASTTLLFKSGDSIAVKANIGFIKQILFLNALSL